MSAPIVWDIVRKNSAFLQKRKHVELTKEPFNLTGKNSYKYSGLANAKAMDVNFDAKKGLYLRMKTKKTNKPVAIHKVKLLKALSRDEKSITTQTGGFVYRKDLKVAALARWKSLRQSLHKKHPGCIKSRK